MYAASLAAAYCVATAGYLAVTFLLTRPQLDPAYQSLSSLIPPDWVWRGVGWTTRSYPIFHFEPEPVQLTLSVLLGASLLLAVHLALFAAADLVYRWRGHPPYWSELRVNKKSRRRICLESLKASAWRSLFALPLAGGVWAVWYGVSQASILTKPALLMGANPAFLLNRVAMLLIYFFVTSATLRRSVLHEVVATGPRCVACGYTLVEPMSPQCPECGATVSVDARPGFEIRGMSLVPRTCRWLIVGLLLLMPLLFPVVRRFLTRFF